MQSIKQGGYGAYMRCQKSPIFQEFYLENKKEVTTKLLPWSAEAQSLKKYEGKPLSNLIIDKF